MLHNRRILTGCTEVGLVAALLSLNAFPAGAGQKGNQLYTLKYKFKAGDVSNYQTSGQFSVNAPAMSAPTRPGALARPGGAGNPMVIPLNSSQKMKVLKVLPDGSGEMEVTMLSSGMAQGGATPTPKTVTYALSPTGVISSVKGASGKSSAGLMSALNNSVMSGSVNVFLPDKPVKPGDTWTHKLTVPQSDTSGTVTGTFVSVGQIGRYKTAHLKLVMTLPINSNAATGAKTPQSAGTPPINLSGKAVITFEDDFAIAEGKLIKSTGNGNVNIAMQMPPSANNSGAPAAAGNAFTAALTLSSTLTQ